ncbi:hypothetical protein PspS35_03735 [Pseudomonas sp. S35]|uniref:hypothetical protein n=1 Tax=Pseudomonas sp. S35 TaxID=1573719 RepID=UPI00132EB342|nr:hypothetical protein [Pseudomonas sp. S35]QHF42941.1 hypothetical protein PspS35_03735 [Pseudomonas sp. S35]
MSSDYRATEAKISSRIALLEQSYDKPDIGGEDTEEQLRVLFETQLALSAGLNAHSTLTSFANSKVKIATETP